ncbi:DUF4188 domain-containing protein [Rhodococcus sp. NPDC019627]|uniref:DUF4188 domain-containing protein n=1 Tax=unclassified Rhodococcus (in: high G+C Gram-positive bacteria) TaxID=192944 RepID=UPI0034077DD3
MSTIEPGRSTHHYDGELVLFLIGMTINRPWRPDLWLPAFLAMPKMLRELSQDPDSGLLGYRLVIEGRGPTLIQYWSSADKLYAYASNPDARHRPAWAAFNRRARRAPGAVGVWHETYSVDRAESIYVGAPVLGLARFTARVPVTPAGNRARNRLAHTTPTASTHS